MRFGVVAYAPGRIFCMHQHHKHTSRNVMKDRLQALLTLLIAAIAFTACGDNDGESGGGGADNANRNVVTDEPAVSRLEFPRLKGGRSIVIVYRTDDCNKYDKDRVNFAVEWDCDKKAQRWSCYQMHSGYSGPYSRVVDGYPNDASLDPADRWDKDYIYGSGFQHGHICPNGDRKYSHDANYQTFYMTNMQPQYGSFNGYSGSEEGLWLMMENKVRDWTPKNTKDTLYVCKGGTIDSEEQILERIDGKMIVPKYFFMALLLKHQYGYRALGFYAEHTDRWGTDENLADYVVSIDELEKLTGIDFFCNLPDREEEKVESKVYKKDWGLE